MSTPQEDEEAINVDLCKALVEMTEAWRAVRRLIEHRHPDATEKDLLTLARGEVSRVIPTLGILNSR